MIKREGSRLQGSDYKGGCVIKRERERIARDRARVLPGRGSGSQGRCALLYQVGDELRGEEAALGGEVAAALHVQPELRHVHDVRVEDDDGLRRSCARHHGSSKRRRRSRLCPRSSRRGRGCGAGKCKARQGQRALPQGRQAKGAHRSRSSWRRMT